MKHVCKVYAFRVIYDVVENQMKVGPEVFNLKVFGNFLEKLLPGGRDKQRTNGPVTLT